MKLLFWCQGAGEFSIARYLLDYCIEKGDSVMLFLDKGTTRLLSEEDAMKYSLSEYDLQDWDMIGRIKVTIDTYKPDVLVMQPSRTWQSMITPEDLKDVKLKIGLECNVYFRGIDAYKLDAVSPSWLDFFVTTFDPEFSAESMRLLYGTDKLPKEIEDKYRCFGWFAPKLEKKQSGDYIFVYTGSGVTGNQWYAQKIMDLIGPERNVLLVGAGDPVIGNFPNLTKVPGLPGDEFEQALINADYAILHEGYGSIGKCLMNKVPFVSIRNGTKFKYIETEPLNTLGYARAVDFKDLDKDNIKKPGPLYKDFEWGVPKTYELIKANV